MLGSTHSRFNTGECSNEESALPTGSILSILLSCFLRSSSSSSWKEKREKRQDKSLKDCSSKVKNSPSLCHYFYLAVLASPPLLPVSLLWLLIQLPARTSNGLYSKSKETFGGVQMGAVMLQKRPCPAKLFSDCSDKVAVIDCSCSINQVWPGAWHRCRISAVMRSGLERRKVVALTVICFSHSSFHLLIFLQGH